MESSGSISTNVTFAVACKKPHFSSDHDVKLGNVKVEKAAEASGFSSTPPSHTHGTKILAQVTGLETVPETPLSVAAGWLLRRIQAIILCCSQ